MTDSAPSGTVTQTKPKCGNVPDPPTVPEIPKRGTCPPPCDCPTPPGGPPSTCLDDLIKCQNAIVKKAERAKAFVDELTAIQDKVVSAQVEYTQQRFKDLRKIWKDQDKAINELIRKLVCAVPCWECLLWCRLCTQLLDIRTLEDRLNGTGGLTKKVYSLYDLQAWHQRNVANMEARVQRIADVMTAWEKPSATLGDVLDKNGTLIDDTSKIIATDPAKALFDVFMTLLPRHWAIRPRGADMGPNNEWKSEIDPKYIDKYLNLCGCTPTPPKDDKSQAKDQYSQEKQQDQTAAKGDGDGKGQDKGQCDNEPDPNRCNCDDGVPDDCCGPDVGILSLRQRLAGPGPLPYLVDPTLFPDIICCLTTERLSPASDQLATAQAGLDAVTIEIDLVKKRITDKTAAIEATFRAELTGPTICDDYKRNGSPGPKQPDGGCNGSKQPEKPASA